MHLVGDLLVRLGADEGVCLVEVIEDEWDFDGVTCPDAVSYTHLTLPTIYSV